MDLKQIIAAASKMFPSADLQGAATKAEQAISGTADTLEGVQSTARRLGIDPNIALMPTRYSAAHKTPHSPRKMAKRGAQPNSPG